MSKQKYAKSEREEARICKTKLFLATIKQKYAKKPFYMQKYAKKKGVLKIFTLKSGVEKLRI